jgi:hypothetical protein
MVHKPYRGRGAGIPIRLLVSVRDGNIPTHAWLDDRTYDITSIYTEFFPTDAPLPPHCLIANAIGEADLCPRALLAAEAIVARSAAPVINPPAERKRFFFEKKNQKTFIHWSAWPETGVAQRRESFLVVFFKKEHPSFLFLAGPPHPT